MEGLSTGVGAMWEHVGRSPWSYVWVPLTPATISTLWGPQRHWRQALSMSLAGWGWEQGFGLHG